MKRNVLNANCYVLLFIILTWNIDRVSYGLYFIRVYSLQKQAHNILLQRKVIVQRGFTLKMHRDSLVQRNVTLYNVEPSSLVLQISLQSFSLQSLLDSEIFDHKLFK